MSELLSIGEAARRLGLSVDTVREMERNGELKAVRTPGGHRRFKPSALDAYLAQRSRTKSTRRAGTTTPLQPARRRQRARPVDEDPTMEQPPDVWDEGPFEPPPPRPAGLAQRSAHEQLIHQTTQSTERIIEQSRLANLKAYGRSLIPYGTSATARSTVFEAMDSYVAASRFPASMPLWETRQAIDAKVAAIMEPFNAEASREAARKAEADARRQERESEDQRLRSLIEHGRSRVLMRTLRWDSEDRRVARDDVEQALKDEVEADWSERDVDALVDDELGEWEEDSDD